jgi:hypothetical protein
MNPWIDVFGWALVIACLIFLRYEIPRAVREIRKILRENNAVQVHVHRQDVGCPSCGVAREPGDPVHGGYRCACWQQ